MTQFREFIERLGWLWGLILAGGLLAPVIGAFAGLSPEGGALQTFDLGLITGLLCLVTVAILWVFFRLRSPLWSKIVFGLAALAALGTLAGYFVHYGTFVREFAGETFIAGCGWTAEALENAEYLEMAVTDQCPGDPAALLEESMPPEEIWTSRSVQRTEFELYALWALLTVSWVFAIGFLALNFFTGSAPEDRKNENDGPESPAPGEG